MNDSSSHLLQDWFAAPRGTALLQSESALLRESLEDCFGWEMLQLGAWGSSRSLLTHARTRSQTLIAAHGENQVDLKARLTQLPIQSDSVDAVLLPHTLKRSIDGKPTEETSFEQIKVNPKIDKQKFAVSK